MVCLQHSKLGRKSSEQWLEGNTDLAASEPLLLKDIS